MVINPPKLPAFLPHAPAHNTLESFGIFSILGGWEDNPYTPAHTHMRRARVRVYVSTIPSSQKDNGNKGFKGLGAVEIREGGLRAGRIA